MYAGNFFSAISNHLCETEFSSFHCNFKYYVAVQGGEDSIRLWGGGPPGGANELAHAHSFYVATVTVLCAAAHTLQKTNQID